MTISGTVCYSKLAKYQKGLCIVEFMRPRGALKFLQDLDCVNGSNDSEPNWPFADKLQPKLDPSHLQGHCFRVNSCGNNNRQSLSIVGNLEGLTHPECVSQLNNDLILKTRESALQKETFCMVSTASNICHGFRTYSVKSSELKYLKSFPPTELLRKMVSKIQLVSSGRWW